MPMIEHSNELINAVTDALGQTFNPYQAIRPGGGSTDETYCLQDASMQVFVKLGDINSLDRFNAEADGLAALGECLELRVPKVITQGVFDRRAALVLEYIALRPIANAAVKLGEGLPALHAITNDAFGWHRDNFIGVTPQVNHRATDWPGFFATRRLKYQFDLAAGNGFSRELADDGERLLAEMGALFSGHDVRPSLLHGDLWTGNAAADDHGRAVIYDPAVYYGDREADIAMSELFGGFGRDFYAAYQSAWPLDDGYPVRKQLYNLYHVLNHLNLFGGGYLGEAKALIAQLLAVLGK
ncbi:MAG: fructosamine kinase family protein [marine bacterium B5-7]|nr:MAG: fructosamine kinase family protein [marine bacterium B5-7]